MHAISVCYIASHAIEKVPEGHNQGSVRVIEAAMKAGVKTSVVSLENSLSHARKGFFPVRSSFKAVRKTSVFPSVRELFSSLPAMAVAKNLDCDLIHLLNITKEVFMLNSRVMNTEKKCITHFYHSSFPFSAYTTFKIRSLLLKLGFFNQVLATNRSLVSYLIDSLGLDGQKVHLVPFPVDVNQFKPRNKESLRQKYGLPTEAPIIAYVGAIDADRGFFSLIESFRRVLRQMPDAILYVSHPNRGDLTIDLARNPSIKDNVFFRGPGPFIEDVYSLADVVVLPFERPYWITAPPLVVLEAMASGTPTVTTPLDAIKDVGTDLFDLMFVNPGDPESLADAIVYALENEDEARTIGLRARENMIRNFSMETVGEILRKTYREIIDS
jgi:glycosyltransferase involved in cell wall biosynthesis